MPGKRRPKNLESDCIKDLKLFFERECRAYVKKTNERFHSGWPDLQILKHGITYYIEVKVNGNKMTKLQLETMKELFLAGAWCFLMDRTYVDEHEHIYRINDQGLAESWTKNDIKELLDTNHIEIKS